MQINILHLYPDLLNLYGDKGNICALSKRLEWRGIEACVFECNEDFSPENYDILYLGGGGEREEAEVFEKLQKKKDVICDYVEKGGVLVATCGGFELLGKLGILDIEIKKAEKRLIGNIVLECELNGQTVTVTGFENHIESVNIKNHTPFGKVVFGKGNNGEDKTEGVVYKNVFATHLHGPLLPKNSLLCDYILSKALENKGENSVILEPVDDNFEQIAQEEIKKRVLNN